jgi:hypothetical protein
MKNAAFWDVILCGHATTSKKTAYFIVLCIERKLKALKGEGALYQMYCRCRHFTAV